MYKRGYGPKGRYVSKGRYVKKGRSKKYIRTFRDLEIYQITEQLSVDIMTKIIPEIDISEYPSKNKLVEKSLDIPLIIAKSHSIRYDDRAESHRLLQDAMNTCNEVIVYLEQARDIYEEKIDKEICNNIVKKYTLGRRKMLNLKKAWEKFDAKDSVNLERRKEDKEGGKTK